MTSSAEVTLLLLSPAHGGRDRMLKHLCQKFALSAEPWHCGCLGLSADQRY